MADRTMDPVASLRCWGPAIALSLGLHAFWWALAPRALDRPVEHARRPVPATHYLRDDQRTPMGELLREDVRAVASPTIFSLQTPMGFSRPLVEEHRSLTPPLNPPEATLDRPGLAAATGVLDPEPVRAADIATLRGIPWTREEESPASATFPVRPADTSLVVQVIWQTPMEGLRNQSLPVDWSVLQDDPRAWEATAYVEFDEMGSVRHVLLERPSTSAERNAGLIRTLRMLQAKPTGEVQGGYLVLRFAGDPQKLVRPAEAAP